MKQKRTIIASAIFLMLAVATLLVYDLFFAFEKPKKNVYDYYLGNFTDVDSSLIHYSEIQQIVLDIEKPKGIAVDQDDNIYVAGKDNIVIYDKNGIHKKKIVTEADALCITLCRKNNIFIGAKDHVEIWDTVGTQKAVWEIKNDKVVITSIAIAEPSVFVADAGNKIVYHYDMDGNFINEIGRKDSLAGIQGFFIPSPYFDVAIGRDGELWAVNTGRHQFESYDKEGHLKSSWEKTSMTLDGFSGCCNPSHIAILPDGSFVTSEKGIVRVKILEPTGEFKCVVATPEQFEKGTRGLDLAVDSGNRVLVLDPKKGLIRIFLKNL